MTNNLKPMIIACIVISIFALFEFGYCINRDIINKGKQPVHVEYFKAGDILEPDYAIPERLIVVDATGLNKDMALIEQGIIEATDGEIAAVFYKHCKPY